MKQQTLKNKVIATLVKRGSNEKDVERWVDKNFEKAASMYSTVKNICDAIMIWD